MTSFLQQQLLKLSAPQTNVYNEKHNKPSILFDSSESKSYTRDDYFDIGKSSLDFLLAPADMCVDLMLNSCNFAS